LVICIRLATKLEQPMNPITEGDKIFKKVVEPITWSNTKNISEAKKLLESLIAETKGLIITDFIDSDNWDKIDGIEINEEKNILFLHWHDYREKQEDEHRKMVRRMVFPAELTSCFLHFNELRIVHTKAFPLIFLRGYAIKDKEIKKLFPDNTSIDITNNEENFSKRVVVLRNNMGEVYECLNTPIFSMVFLPKNCFASSTDSKELLFQYNLSDSILRFQKIRKALEKDSAKDLDEICEKANSIRRIFEYVLKVECCYRFGQINLKKEYSDLRLGDLISLIKSNHENYIVELLNQIRDLSNEFSHETGKPVLKENAVQITLLAILYTERLKSLIRMKPNPHYDI
jgi:hypothetical protein